MQVIPYNPATDPWFQLGRAVSGGLGLLADNRMARGEAKNKITNLLMMKRINITGF